MGRIITTVVVAIAAVALWHFAAPSVQSSVSGGGGTSKAEDAVRNYATSRQLPAPDGVSCSDSSVSASSIEFVAKHQGSKSTTMYDCAVSLTSLGMAPQTWCVAGLSSSDPWLTVLESCQAWANGKRSP